MSTNHSVSGTRTLVQASLETRRDYARLARHEMQACLALCRWMYATAGSVNNCSQDPSHTRSFRNMGGAHHVFRVIRTHGYNPVGHKLGNRTGNKNIPGLSPADIDGAGSKIGRPYLGDTGRNELTGHTSLGRRVSFSTDTRTFTRQAWTSHSRGRKNKSPLPGIV